MDNTHVKTPSDPHRRPFFSLPPPLDPNRGPNKNSHRLPRTLRLAPERFAKEQHPGNISVLPILRLQPSINATVQQRSEMDEHLCNRLKQSHHLASFPPPCQASLLGHTSDSNGGRKTCPPPLHPTPLQQRGRGNVVQTRYRKPSS